MKIALQSTFLFSLLTISLWGAYLRAYSPAPIKDAPEPTREQLIDKAKLDPGDAAALDKHLKTILSTVPGVAEVWLPSLRRAEHYRLIESARALGYGDQFGRGRWAQELPKQREELAANRLVDPARLTDAILRQLEDKGTPDQIEFLLVYASYQKTEWGRWKFYATVQGILARHSAAEITANQRLTPVLAMLLRDLTPAQRSSLAAALLKRERTEKVPFPGTFAEPTLRTALWLAWSLSSTDPEAALPFFRRGLESTDPALRLLAGLGVARISEGPIPYRLTENRKTTEVARAAWLKGLKLRWAKDFDFPDPLERPVLRRNRGGRIDLLWLKADASIERAEEDVWPGVLHVLSDGTLYSARNGTDQSVALTGPDGEVLARFPEGRYNCSDGSIEAHGGFWALETEHQWAAEYSLTGERIWECPLIEGNTSARFISGAGPGRVLLLRSNSLEILNRRGDVIWSVKAGASGVDPRRACMVDPDTVLISCQTKAELHHRTKGKLKEVGGPFHSLVEVRYHPEKPWMMFDGGKSTVVLHDPIKKTAVSQKLGWDNSSPNLVTKWLPAGKLSPEE